MNRQASRDGNLLAMLGQRVRHLRALRGMSRKALSAAAGISERYIAQLESGKGNISVLLLNRISAAIGAGLDELFCDDVEDWRWWSSVSCSRPPRGADRAPGAFWPVTPRWPPIRTRSGTGVLR
jgi:DNA-binding XRE family transcriptional regulator